MRREALPLIAPPKNASDSAKRGFLVFREECVACHAINGLGGNAGPELNYPVNITEYFDLTVMKKWISNPKSVRYNAKMPPLRETIDDRPEKINDIVNYLQSMATKKHKPSSGQ